MCVCVCVCVCVRMVDLLNPTRYEKKTGKVDKPNHRQRIQNIFVYIHTYLWPSRLELQNTPTPSLQRGKTPQTSVLDMILNDLIVMLL